MCAKWASADNEKYNAAALKPRLACEFWICLAFLQPEAYLTDSSQVKLLITNNSFCIVQRATERSKTGIFRDYGVAEAPPRGFKPAGLTVCIFSLSFCSFFLLIWR
jgi:hypothetical protein